jgi:hypothetical protein
MSDTATAVAESQSAPVVETIALPKSGTSEYAEWRVNAKAAGDTDTTKA